MGENIFAQGTIFTRRFIRTFANNHPKERKKERRKEGKKTEKTGWNQFNTHACVHTYPFLLVWSRALPALPSGRNALSARPCPGQWLSTDYAALKRSVGDIMVMHRMQSNLPFYIHDPKIRDMRRHGF